MSRRNCWWASTPATSHILLDKMSWLLPKASPSLYALDLIFPKGFTTRFISFFLTSLFFSSLLKIDNSIETTTYHLKSKQKQHTANSPITQPRSATPNYWDRSLPHYLPHSPLKLTLVRLPVTSRYQIQCCFSILIWLGLSAVCDLCLSWTISSSWLIWNHIASYL